METVLSLLIGIGLSAACGFRVFVRVGVDVLGGTGVFVLVGVAVLDAAGVFVRVAVAVAGDIRATMAMTSAMLTAPSALRSHGSPDPMAPS